MNRSRRWRLIDRDDGRIARPFAFGSHEMSVEPLNPGDDAAPGTPGTGENVCPTCGGSGRIDSAECNVCGGSGRVIEGIGGG
jgi:hypothetical protein